METFLKQYKVCSCDWIVCYLGPMESRERRKCIANVKIINFSLEEPYVFGLKMFHLWIWWMLLNAFGTSSLNLTAITTTQHGANKKIGPHPAAKLSGLLGGRRR